MAFAIVFNTETKDVTDIIPGVDEDSGITVSDTESVVYKEDPGIIPSSAKVDADGNIYEYIPPKTPEEIWEEKVEVFKQAVQRHLDEKAREYDYDDIVSACSYAGYDNPYQAEGQAFLQWRGSVWQYCYDQLGEIEAGNRDEPTVEEFIAELPEYQPPRQ